MYGRSIYIYIYMCVCVQTSINSNSQQLYNSQVSQPPYYKLIHNILSSSAYLHTIQPSQSIIHIYNTEGGEGDGCWISPLHLPHLLCICHHLIIFIIICQKHHFNPTRGRVVNGRNGRKVYGNEGG